MKPALGGKSKLLYSSEGKVLRFENGNHFA
jgi:hypothetical protein